jgi:hypothetical protein
MKFMAHNKGSAREGSALIIVLILLSLMAALMVSNAVSLRRLRVELQLLDQKQKQRITQSASREEPESGAGHEPEVEAVGTDRRP